MDSGVCGRARRGKHASDVDSCEFSEISGKLTDAIEVFRVMSKSGECDDKDFVGAAGVIGDACRRFDLSVFEVELFNVASVLMKKLEQRSAKAEDVENALIDCLVSVGYQENPALLKRMVSAGYLRVIELVLSVVWRKRHDKEVYEMLALVAGMSDDLRTDVMGVISPMRVCRSINLHLDCISEKCRLLSEYGKSVLTADEKEAMVKVFQFCFRQGDRDTMYHAGCGLYRVLYDARPVYRCFFADNFLQFMLSKTAEHDRVTETIIYIVMAVAKNTTKPIGVDMHFLLPFLESGVDVCQIAACRCLTVIVNTSPEDLQNLGPQEIMEVVKRIYFQAQFSGRKYLHELIIAIFYRFPPSVVLPIIAEQFMPIVCAMSQQSIDDSMKDVFSFYLKLFDAANAQSIPMKDLFRANDGFANIETLMPDLQSPDLHCMAQQILAKSADEQ